MGAILPTILGQAFPEQGDPYSRYKVAGGRVVDLGSPGGPSVAIDAPNPKDPIAKLRARAEAAGLRPGTPEYAAFMQTGGRSGSSIELADGTRIDLNGGAGRIDKKNRRDVEAGIIGNDELSIGLDQLREYAGIGPDGKLTPEGRQLFTYGGRIEAGVDKFRSKADLPDWVPFVGGRPDEEETAFLQRRTKMEQAANQVFNAYRKEITGAAAAVQELERLQKAFVNPNMAPDEFEAAFQQYTEFLSRIRSARVQLLQRGIDPTTKQGGKALDDIVFGEGGPSASPSAPAKPLSEYSDEELRRMLGE